MTNGAGGWTVAAVAAVALAGCGGGGGGSGGGSGGGDPLLGGIEGSGHRVTSSGAVTALGSIFVNGVEYATGSATITIDGLPAREGDLDVGQVAVVEGVLNTDAATGVARRVTVGIALAGRVTALDAALGRLRVLGQVVQLDGATDIEGRIADQPLGGLAVGSDLEVTGFADSAGVLFARRIAPRRSTTPLLVTGYATNLDAAARTFAINGQTIDYGTAVLSGFDGRPLAGAAVRVQVGTVRAGALVAERVELRDLRLPGMAGDSAALQGWVTRFASPTDFDVDGHPVVATSATRIEGPENGQSFLRLDAFVAVTGRLLANGVVEAAEVRTNNLIALASRIYGVGPLAGQSGQYLRADLWEWSGDRCRLAPETAVSVDGVAASVAALEAGEVADIYEHYVNTAVDDVHVVQDSVCQIVAVEHVIRGPLESKPTDSGSFVVMGQRVWLDTSFEAVSKGIDAHASLAPLNPGSVVEVSGHLTAEGDVLATRVHAARVGSGYHVTGLARDVDPVTRQLRLGGLVVYFDAAELVGFASGVPRDDERIYVHAGALPTGDVLRADVVRYAGGLPRGSEGTVIRMGGLVTRHGSATDFAVDGRSTVAHAVQGDPASAAALRCDMGKVHPNLRFTNLLASVGPAATPPRYFFAVCEPGRRIDARGPAALTDREGGVVIGPVDAVDVGRRSLRVGGTSVTVPPDVLLTRFVATDTAGNGTTAPVLLGEIQPGERVEILVQPVAPGQRAAQQVLLGDRAATVHAAEHVPGPDKTPALAPVLMTGAMESAADPVLTLESGIRIRTSASTVFVDDDCGLTTVVTDRAAFWRDTPPGQLITATGVAVGAELAAERVYRGAGAAYCYGF